MPESAPNQNGEFAPSPWSSGSRSRRPFIAATAASVIRQSHVHVQRALRRALDQPLHLPLHALVALRLDQLRRRTAARPDGGPTAISVAPAAAAAARPSASWPTASPTEPTGLRAHLDLRQEGLVVDPLPRRVPLPGSDPVRDVRQLERVRVNQRGAPPPARPRTVRRSPKRCGGGARRCRRVLTASPPARRGRLCGRTPAPPRARSHSRRWRCRRRRRRTRTRRRGHGVLVDREAAKRGRDSRNGLHGHMRLRRAGRARPPPRRRRSSRRRCVRARAPLTARREPQTKREHAAARAATAPHRSRTRCDVS